MEQVFMKEIQEWNPYYIGASCSLYRPEQFYPWLYPYGSSRHYISLWNDPEQMEDVEDKKRIMEMYPLMARRLQPYVEECCDRLEYEGSMMYDEYPDRFMLYHICSLVKDEMTKDASAQEMPGGFLDDLIQVLVYQEISRRRCRRRRCRQYFPR